MGKKRTPKPKTKLPPAGAVFAFPLGDGRLGACRVLQDASSPLGKERKGGAVLAATCNWIGDDLPAADDPALRSILQLTHHSWKNKPNLLWAMGEPPKNFVLIGHLPPSPTEEKLKCTCLGFWDHLTIQPLMQWRWDHDRAAVLAEDAIEQQAQMAARETATAARKKYLAKITLQELAEHRFFPKWTRLPSRKLTKLSRQIMSNTVQQLIDLGVDAKKRDRLAVLRQCIDAFNELDAQEVFIETDEREDICFEFEAICHAAGLGGEWEKLTDRRNW